MIDDHYCQTGETSLMVACTEGHLDIVTYLVDHGADLEAINDVRTFLTF